MSAHIELDVSDDGTVVMTHRRSKGAEIERSAIGPVVGNDAAGVWIHGGEVDGITHGLLICTKQTLRQILDNYSAKVAPDASVVALRFWQGIG